MKLLIYYLLWLPTFGGNPGYSSKYDKTQNPLKVLSIFIYVLFIIYGPMTGVKKFYPGVFLLAIGSSLVLSAKLTLKKQFTCRLCILSNHKLIKTGIYKYLKHPAYLGYVFLFTGSALIFKSVYMYIFLIVYTPLLFYRAKVEDEMLNAHFRGD